MIKSFIKLCNVRWKEKNKFSRDEDKVLEYI